MMIASGLLRLLPRGILVGLLFAGLALIGTAQALSTPQRTGWVTDEAGILDPQLESDVARRLMELKRRTGAEVVVVTLTSLQGASIETWGDLLGESWNVGRAEGKDDGALLIVAPNDRKVRIAVGYGLGYRLSDSDAVSIIQDRILPSFRRGDFAGGVDDGVTAIFERVDRRAAIRPPAGAVPAAETSSAATMPEIERSGTPAAPAPASLRPKSDERLALTITIVVVLLAGVAILLLVFHGMSHMNVAVSSAPRDAERGAATPAPDPATTAKPEPVVQTSSVSQEETFGEYFLRTLLSNLAENSRDSRSSRFGSSSSSSGTSWSRPSSSGISFSFGGGSGHSSSSSSGRSFSGSSSSGGSRRSFGGGASGSW
jgi:uncharacterized protein